VYIAWYLVLTPCDQPNYGEWQNSEILRHIEFNKLHVTAARRGSW